MKKSTALRLSLLATAAFFLFLVFQFLSFAPAGTASVHPDRRIAATDARINLNSADAEELQKLPGIGPVLSEAIVARRAESGPFHTVDELLQVPGIGEKTLAALREYVYISAVP